MRCRSAEAAKEGALWGRRTGSPKAVSRPSGPPGPLCNPGVSSGFAVMDLRVSGNRGMIQRGLLSVLGLRNPDKLHSGSPTFSFLCS